MKNINGKINTLTAIFPMVLLVGTTNLKANDTNEKLVVSIIKQTNKHSLVQIKTDDAEETLHVPNDLAINSPVNLNSESGKLIAVKRTSNGISLELDGKSVLLPKFRGKYGVKLSRTQPLQRKMEKDIVVSGAHFSPEQIAIIQRAFADAGVTKPVKFSKHKIISVNSNFNTSSTNSWSTNSSSTNTSSTNTVSTNTVSTRVSTGAGFVELNSNGLDSVELVSDETQSTHLHSKRTNSTSEISIIIQKKHISIESSDEQASPETQSLTQKDKQSEDDN